MKEVWMVEWSDHSFAHNAAFSTREAGVAYIESIGKNLRNFQKVTLDLDLIDDGCNEDECQYGHDHTVYEFENRDYNDKYIVEAVRLTRYIIDSLD